MTAERVHLTTGFESGRFVSGHDFSRAATDMGCDGFGRCPAARAKSPLSISWFSARLEAVPCTDQERSGDFQTR